MVGVFSRYCVTISERDFWHGCAPTGLRNMYDDLPEVHKITLGFHHTSLEEHLSRNPQAVHATDDLGRTALYWAAASSSTSAIYTLLEHSAEVSALDNYGYSAIYAATSAAQPSIDVVEALLKHNPSVSPNKEQRSMLHFAVSTEDAACRRAIMRYAIRQGADIDAKSVYGWTPLISMAFKPCSEPMAGFEMLLASGADINSVNKAGRNALFKAVDQQRPENARVLLDYGADHLIIDRCGNSLLHDAARFANVKMLKVLFDHGMAGVDVMGHNKKVRSSNCSSAINVVTITAGRNRRRHLREFLC